MNEKKKRNHYSKRKFMTTFIVVMGLFAIVRHAFSVNVVMRKLESVEKKHPMSTDALDDYDDRFYAVNTSDSPEEVFVGDSTDLLGYETSVDPADVADTTTVADSIRENEEKVQDSLQLQIPADNDRSTTGGSAHRVIGVHSWDESFPDIQPVQLAAAKKNGIRPIRNRSEIDKLIASHRLVNICNSPFYTVDNLTHSMPYLVPKAQHLLNTICLNFIDSLQIKGIPPHLPMVTSVLRTVDDVAQLQKGNKNATTHSCHCYGTTVDITYNRFVPIVGSYDRDAPLSLWELRMKQVLAEVLRDLRNEGLCYVKYERKQACFHLTVR